MTFISVKEIEGIEADIKQLRSQVKMTGSNTFMLESDDTSSMMSDDVEPGIYLPRSRHENHRFAPLPVDMAIYPPGTGKFFSKDNENVSSNSHKKIEELTA